VGSTDQPAIGEAIRLQKTALSVIGRCWLTSDTWTRPYVLIVKRAVAKVRFLRTF